jgi:hypothetical protein
MDKFVEFDNILTSFRDNAWLDDGVILAGDILRTFESEDWKELSNNWPIRDERWQCYAAYVLSEGAPEYCIPVLMGMLKAGSQLLQYNACDALRTALQLHKETRKVDQDLIRIIDELQANSTGFMTHGLDELRKRLVSR